MMKKVLVLSLLFISFTLYSTPEDEASRLLEQQQRRIDQERTRQEQERRLHELENSSLGEETRTEAEEDEHISEPKFLIREIRIRDERNLLTGNEEFSLAGKYRNTRMGGREIRKLLTEITNKIISKGYITSSVNISPDNDLSTGILNLEVVPGIIEDIRINEENFLDRYKEFFMFRKNRGKVLNIRDLDQATENFNSLRSNNMEMEILPGTKPFHSIINVRNIMKDKYQVSLTGNNYGESNQSGMWRHGVGLSIDSPLGIGDSLSFSYLTVNEAAPDRSWKKTLDELKPGEILPIGPTGYDPAKGDHLPYRRRLDMFNFGYSMRFRDWALRLNSSRSISEGSFYAYSTVYDMKSSSHTLSAEAEKTLWRNQRSRIGIGVGIRRKHTDSYLEKARLSDRKLTIGRISLNGSAALFRGLLGVSLGYEKGLRIFHAERDEGKLAENPKAEGEKITLDVNYYKPITGRLAYRFSLSGTYSRDVLYSSERQTIGGVGSVPGYNRTETLQGDRAAEIGSELSYSIPVFRKWGHISPYIGYSYGVAEKNRDTSRYRLGYMTGLLAGIRYSSRLLDFDLGYAKPLKHSSYLKPKDKELYFTGTLKVAF